MACSLISLMDANGDVGDGLEIAYIKYISVLVYAYWLDIPVVLL